MLFDEAFGDNVQRGVLGLRMRLLLNERGMPFGVVDEGGVHDDIGREEDEDGIWLSNGVDMGDTTLKFGWCDDIMSGVMIMFDGR